MTTPRLFRATIDHCPGSAANGSSCAITTVNPNGKYPGDHRVGRTTCKTCHTTNRADYVFYPHPTDTATPPRSLVPECAACHSSDFRRKGRHIGGENGTVYQNRNCGASGCHRVSDSDF